jgi:DNA-binding MarR family transcriptional regulator
MLQLFYVTIISGGNYMEELYKAKQLRESIREMERKLGILEECKVSCGGITITQCHALVEIGRAKSISLIELSEILNLDNSTMSRTVNNLVNNGLVERELNRKDRRYVTIKLSESGIKVFENIETNMNSFYKKVFHTIPCDKQEQVIESMQILLEAISQHVYPC